jgi:hypothetical protein
VVKKVWKNRRRRREGRKKERRKGKEKKEIKELNVEVNSSSYKSITSTSPHHTTPKIKTTSHHTTTPPQKNPHTTSKHTTQNTKQNISPRHLNEQDRKPHPTLVPIKTA